MIFFTKKLPDNKRGFSLVELLVALAIIGIIVAVAIPAFQSYRSRAYNSQSLSNIKDGLTAEESYYSVNQVYKGCDSVAACEAVLPGFAGNDNVCLEFVIDNPVTGLNGTSYHTSGSKTHRYLQNVSGIVSTAGVGADCDANTTTVATSTAATTVAATTTAVTSTTTSPSTTTTAGSTTTTAGSTTTTAASTATTTAVTTTTTIYYYRACSAGTCTLTTGSGGESDTCGADEDCFYYACNVSVCESVESTDGYSTDQADECAHDADCASTTSTVASSSTTSVASSTSTASTTTSASTTVSTSVASTSATTTVSTSVASTSASTTVSTSVASTSATTTASTSVASTSATTSTTTATSTVASSTTTTVGTHMECLSGTCQATAGSGPDLCSNDEDCYYHRCEEPGGPGSGWVCTYMVHGGAGSANDPADECDPSGDPDVDCGG